MLDLDHVTRNLERTPVDAAEYKSTHLTHLATAKRFCLSFGKDSKHVPGLGWLLWTGRVWELDQRRRMLQLVAGFGEDYRVDALSTENPKIAEAIFSWARQVENPEHDEKVLRYCESPLHLDIDELDDRPGLINFGNCTLEIRPDGLRTLDNAAGDYLTRIIPGDYVPDAPCPAFLETLARVLPDSEVGSFFQRLVGYALLGSGREQIVAINYGTGANGKSVIANAIRESLGNYGIQIDPRSFLTDRAGEIRNDLADLRGVRLAFANEIAADGRLDETLIKSCTGGELIRCRRLYHESFQYKPQFVLFLACNHRPRIYGTDLGIWRRIVLVPWDVVIPAEERNRDLPATLAREKSGIASWCVDGALEYMRDGLNPPARVLAATEQYRNGEDTIGEFLRECCVPDPTGMIGAADLLEKFKGFCGVEMSATRFSKAILEHGYDRVTRDHGRRYYIGLSYKHV